MTSKYKQEIENIRSGIDKESHASSIFQEYNCIVAQSDTLQKAMAQSIAIPRDFKGLSSYKEKIILTAEQKDVIIGCLLGDASLKSYSGKGLMVIEQKNVPYLLHLYLMLAPIIRNLPKLRVQQRLATSKLRGTYYFSTLQQLQEYYTMFYVDGIKCPPLSHLEQHLTERAIAYWFMDDGSRAKPGYRLNTQGFSYGQVVQLSNIISKRYDIVCTINQSKTGCLLYIGSSESLKFRTLVEPYIINSMRYKLG